MKPWWKSKTVWFNVLMAVLAGAEGSLNVFQPLLPVNVWPVFVAVVTCLNLVLRAVSTQTITK
jgi:hypothetical protein